MNQVKKKNNLKEKKTNGVLQLFDVYNTKRKRKKEKKKCKTKKQNTNYNNDKMNEMTNKTYAIHQHNIAIGFLLIISIFICGFTCP